MISGLFFVIGREMKKRYLFLGDRYPTGSLFFFLQLRLLIWLKCNYNKNKRFLSHFHCSLLTILCRPSSHIVFNKVFFHWCECSCATNDNRFLCSVIKKRRYLFLLFNDFYMLNIRKKKKYVKCSLHFCHLVFLDDSVV